MRKWIGLLFTVAFAAGCSRSDSGASSGGTTTPSDAGAPAPTTPAQKPPTFTQGVRGAPGVTVEEAPAGDAGTAAGTGAQTVLPDAGAGSTKP